MLHGRSPDGCDVADRRCAVHPVGMIDNERIVTNKALGARLKMMRQLRELTQEQLADLCDLASDTIRRAEASAFSPSFATMVKMAAGLGVPVPTLMCDGYDQADDLAEYIRSLPDREFRIGVAVVRILRRYAVVLPSGESPSNA